MRGLIHTHPKLAIAALCTVLLTLFATPARADSLIAGSGEGAGEINRARGTTIDTTAGLLYLADSENNRVDVFDANNGAFLRAFGWGVADGTTNALQVCTTSCFKGIEGNGAGQLSSPQGLAVDNNAASPAFQDVYVYDSGNHRVQRFTSAGAFVSEFGTTGTGPGQFGSIRGVGVVGAAGTVYVIDTSRSVGDCNGVGEFVKRVQKFTPTGALTEAPIQIADQPCGDVQGFATDSTGAFYVANVGGSGAVRKYSNTGTPFGAPFPVDPSFNINALATGPADELYVGDHTDGATVLEYSSAGAQTRAFYGSTGGIALAERIHGLAVYPNPPFANAAGDIYVVDREGARLVDIDFPLAGAIVHPAPASTKADPIGNTKATLKALVNPEAKPSKYFFEYISDADYVAAGDSFGAGTVKTNETTVPGAADFILHGVSTAITGLFPEAVYHVRAGAVNSDGGPNLGPEVTFETRKPIELGEAWSTAVAADTAVLHAEANPLGIPATARFEYVDQETYEETNDFENAKKTPPLSSPPIDLGEGEAMKEALAQLFELKPGTTYRYRLLATNRCEPEPAPLCDFKGPEGTFTTSKPTQSPVIECPNQAFRTGQAARLPDCRAYEMVSPVDKNGSNVEVTGTISGYPAGLDQAALNGQSVTYSTYKAFGKIVSAPYANQYLARRDASQGWLNEAISPKREGPSIMTLKSVELDRQYKYFSSDLCNGWLVQDANPVLAPGGIEGYGGIYRRSSCGPATGGYEAVSMMEAPLTQSPTQPPYKFIPEPQGASADGRVAIFRVADNLTADAPPQPLNCVVTDQCDPRLYEVREGQIRLVCILPGGAVWTGRCSAGTFGGAEERAASLQNAISADGSRIFFTTYSGVVTTGPLYVRILDPSPQTIQISSGSAQFRAAADDGSKVIYTVGGDLFEFDVDSETETPIAAGVTGVAGASEDASRVYFTSTEVLDSGASAGRNNFYLYEKDGGFQFIATLPAEDVLDGEGSPVGPRPITRTSRITPDGEQIVFMSRGRLSGYDSTDAVSKQADQEVFLYDSTANSGAGELRCISCNPTNARPVGRFFNAPGQVTSWIAARIPTWESQLYGQRVLSDDGQRLYFNSFEALVSRDTNGQEDVYQWEALGSGSCTSTSLPSYSPPNGGCIDLISTGESPKGSELLDIGANGNDVFFKTSSSLLKQDPGLLDIYDARVNGGFPPPPEPPAPCEGEACSSPPPPPNDPTPASAGFRGAGDPRPQGSLRKACPKGKRKVRKAGKQRCVQQKKDQRKRHSQRSQKGGNR
jgi:hypothetical protein